MSAWTLLEGKQFCRDNNFDDTSARGTRNIVKICNDALSAMHEIGKWDFMQRIGTLTFKAPASTGTVSVNAAGTTVTGVGTAFAAADVGSYIRMNGENDTYIITARASTTSITIAAYQGAANLSAVTYEITNERVQLPSRFRDFERPVLTTEGWQLMKAPSLLDLLQMRIFYQQTGTPRLYAIEEAEVSSVATPYIWIYPSPSAQRVIQFVYYAWPAEAALDADDFGLPAVEAARRIHRLFIKAYISEQQGNASKFGGQLQYAQAEARKCLGLFRQNTDTRQKRMWSAEREPNTLTPPLNVQWAPGEPQYTD